MDPLSLVSLLGIAVAGRQLANGSDRKEGYVNEPVPNRETMPFFGRNINTPGDNLSAVTNNFSGNFNPNEPMGGIRNPKKEIVASMGDSAPNVQYPFGQPVYNLYNRQNVSSRMNNLSSVERRFVGPGLGVPASVPAYGGYQQEFRIMPNNVGAYRLTTLPGRSGPAKNFVDAGQKRMVVTQDRAPKTYQLLGKEGVRPMERGRAQGQGGALTGGAGRENYIKTMRPTVRSEIGYRGDGLSYGTAKRVVSFQTSQETPTRNKASLVSRVNDVAAPGISSFGGAYDLVRKGISLDPTDRGKSGRANPGGRMNIPTGSIGGVTANRSSASTDRMGGAGNQSIGQNYEVTWAQNNNAYKGNANPLAQDLNVAKRQLRGNPFARSIN